MFRHIELKNKYGFTIRGYLNRPYDASQVVVFLHGFTGNITENHMHFRNISRMLEKEKIASLRMGYTGNAESDGEFSDFSFKVAADDARLMLDYVSSLGFAKVSILGYSMGGMLTASLCNYKPVHKLVLWSPACKNSPKWESFFEYGDKMENGNYYLQGFELSKCFLDGLDELNEFGEARKFQGDVLIAQGSMDSAVDPVTAKRYTEAFKNSSLLWIDGANHEYEKIAEQKELYDATVSFLKK